MENFELFNYQIALSEMLFERVANHSTTVLPRTLIHRGRVTLGECHACYDAFVRDRERIDPLGAGTSAAGLVADLPIGLRELDQRRESCLGRLKAVEHTVNSMVSVITMEGVLKLCEKNGVPAPAITEDEMAAEKAAGERRILMIAPLHGPILLRTGATIDLEWETVGQIPRVDVHLHRQNTNDLLDLAGLGPPPHASKTLIAGAVENVGVLEWAVPASLPAGDYFVSVRCSRAGKVVSAKSCLLCVSPKEGASGAPDLASVSVLRPAALTEHWTRMKGWNVKVWRPGETQAIRWAVSGPVTAVNIFLIDGSDESQPQGALRECVAERIGAADGELLWTVPKKEGKWFYFEVQSSEDERVLGTSGYVAISPKG